MRFADLRLVEPILRAVESQGYTIATPIQAQAIGPVLEGKDVLGCAQTGTGKTAAFALPILHRLAERSRPTGHSTPRARCLILCPTRELAIQIGESFDAYGQNLRLHHAVIFGGVSQVHQVASLRRGVDTIIATPGRLLDLKSQGKIDLSAIEIFVLDEADRMLDMGFIPDIRRIIAELPAKKQTLLFSATMPAEIRDLAESLLHHPTKIHVAPDAPTAEGIDQSVYFVPKANKAALLAHLVENVPMTRAIVFVRTKRGADRVVRHLHKYGVKAEAIHSDKSQGSRQRAMERFRAGKIPLLIATDIASRGIDVDGITHVVNYDITHEPETYVHRIGRTARAGASGAAISLCDDEERPNLRGIEKLIGRKIAVKTDHPEYPAGPSGPGGTASGPKPESRAPVQHGHRRGDSGGHGAGAHPSHRPGTHKPARPAVHSHKPTQTGAPSSARPAHKPHQVAHSSHGVASHKPGRGVYESGAPRQHSPLGRKDAHGDPIELKPRRPHSPQAGTPHAPRPSAGKPHAHRPMGAKHRSGHSFGPRRGKRR